MRIEAVNRVVYANNPLAEVVCQIRFVQVDNTEKLFEAFKSSMPDQGYVDFREERSIPIVPPVVSDLGEIRIEIPQIQIQHFSTAEGQWQVSVCGEFVALTCLKYSDWHEFFGRLLPIIKLSSEVLQSTPLVRVGLRYKDVIERESLGLTGVPWHELVSSFLLGPMAPNALADGQTPSDNEVQSASAQSILKLENSTVLLQSALLTSTDNERRAFLIDADFFIEGEIPLMTDVDGLKTKLDSLHVNAGALFRRCITERLHHALRPSS